MLPIAPPVPIKSSVRIIVLVPGFVWHLKINPMRRCSKFIYLKNIFALSVVKTGGKVFD